MTPAGTAVVALLDTGVDASHPDLSGQLVAGTSILDGSAGTADPNGHGTWMAGIIAAATDNGTGIAGIGYAGVSIMPVTVLDSAGLGTDSDIIEGIVWAVANGADVINMSFSNPGYSAALQAAIDYAWANDVVLVAAVGNDGLGSATFPAGDRGVIGVSNTNQADALNASSNYGPAVFLGAPGTDIVTTALGGGTTSVTGTSASSAEVAAAAALLRAADPSASNGAIVGRLARNADAAGTVDQTGNGRLNLSRAIADSASDSVQPAGAAPVGSGGPLVGPYVAGATRIWDGSSSTDWSTGANWSGNTVPAAGDTAVIPTGMPNYPNISSGVKTVKVLTVNSGGSVTVSGGTLDFTDDSSNAGTINVSSGTLTSSGDKKLTNTGTLTVSSTGIFGASVDDTKLTNDGTFNLSGTGTSKIRDFKGAGTTNASGAILQISHDWGLSTGGIFDGTGGTVEFTTAADAGGGAAFATGTIQFFNLVVSGTKDPGFDADPSSSILIRGNFTNSNTTLTNSANVTFTLNGTGAQTITSASTSSNTTFGHLVINKASGTATLASGILVAGNASITAGVLDASTFGFSRQPSGGTITVANGATLKLGANTTTPNNTFSTFTTKSLGATSTIEYNGTGAQTVATGFSYGHLIVSGGNTKTATTTGLSVAGNFTNASGTTFTGTALTHNVTGNLSNSGTLTFTSATLNLAGNWTNSGTFNAGTSTVNFNGTTGQTMSGSTFNNLTINDPAGVTMLTDETVNGMLTLTSGDLNTGAFTLTMPVAATSAISSGATDVVGNVKRTGPFVTNTAYSFGNWSNSIAFTSAGTKPTEFTVNLVKAAPTSPAFPGTSISRTYTISQAGGSGFSASLRLHYLTGELNGLTAGNLQLWKANGTWAPQGWTGKVDLPPVQTWIELSGVTSFSAWTLADKATQAITVTTPAPASAEYGSSFGVAATSSSGLAVAITTTGGCSGSGSGAATITMTSGTTSCVVHYNQAGDANYIAATEVTSTTTATKRALSITATSFSKVYGVTYLFDETSPSTDFSVAGLLPGDTVDSVTLSSAGAAAGATVAGGPYAVTVSTALGTGLANYTIGYTPGSITVTPAGQLITFGALADK
ncbi:MAG: S8 family serine peptidase, partial [Chloroflexota bacterium]